MGSVRDARAILKISAAAAIAWWLGNLAGQPRPVFAAIVRVLVIPSDSAATRRGSIRRVVGVLAVALGADVLDHAITRRVYHHRAESDRRVDE